MFFYEVGYTTWEECPVTTLWREKKFTQEEFNQILLDCYAEANKINRSKHDEWFNEWDKAEMEKGEGIMYIQSMKYKPRVHDLNGVALELLVEKYGFHNMDIIAQFIPNDNYDIVPDEDGNMREYDDGGIFKMIRERINIIEPRDNKIDNILKKDGV